jgi:hypothetical protein
MGIGSGLNSQVGFAAESTWGTFVAPNRFVHHKTARADRAATRVQGQGIAAGRMGPLASQYAETTVWGEGALTCDVPNKGMGVLYNVLMGGAVTPSALSGSAYAATFPLADTYGKSLSFQVGAPIRDGSSVIAQSLAGGKILSAEFSCDIAGYLAAALEIDAKTFSTSESLATASYTGTRLFKGSQMALKMGTYNSESAISGVKSVTCRINRPHDTQDHTAGQAGAKSQPVLNDKAEITLTIVADWLAKATFQDLAHGVSATSLVWEFVGPLITGSYYETWRLAVPSVNFAPATQGVDGPGELVNTWTASWTDDATNLPTLYTISTDTTL